MASLEPHALAAAAAAEGPAPVVPTPALVDAWRQAHHAAQIASEVGKAWAPVAGDDSHSSFVWERGALVGVAVPGARPFRAALRVASLALELAALDGEALAQLPLAGVTLEQGMAWIRKEAERLAGTGPRQPAQPAPDLPRHPVAAGARFVLGEAFAFVELARLLGAADAVLRRVAAGLPGASDVRCWPHHFDLATLAPVGSSTRAAATKTIGVGLAVPDAISAAGYWYVSPWAQPPRDADALRWAALAHGRWIERGAWRMAALPLDEIAAIAAPDARGRALASFLVGAIEASREALGD
jgi:hypothetical protein